MISSFVIILFAVGIYGLQHSLFASLRAKELAARWLGDFGRRAYRLFYVIVGTLTLAPVLALVAFLPNRQLYAILFPWTILSGMGQLAGLVGLFLAVTKTGTFTFLGLDVFSSAESSVRPSRLVTGGLYRWVRHPIYSCSLLVLWLTPVMSVNLLALNMGISLYFWIGSIFEERKLLHEFGEEYQVYCQRTPRLIPQPWRAPR
jgi:methanethiol S-methyltransferase